MRKAQIERKTKETQIALELDLDGCGKYDISTGMNFFNHMLEQFAAHSGFDVVINAKSLDGDAHHIVEDVAIALGQAFKQALGDKKGIERYGSMVLPMDEALIQAVVDLSGRAVFKNGIKLEQKRVSDFETELLGHFFNSFAQNAQIALHLRYLDGEDTHHIIEGTFKSVARALKLATQHNGGGQIPSTKGIL